MRRDGGFSLLEAILSLSLLCLLFVLCLPFLHLQRQVLARQQARQEEFDALVSAVSWICRDLQEAGYHWDGTPIQQLEEESIRYVLSRDEAEGFAVSNRRLVEVFRNGGDLMYRIRRWDGDGDSWERGSVQKLATGLASLRFRGFDRNGDPAERLQDVTAVEVLLKGVQSGVLRTYVTLRNGRGLAAR